MCVCVCGWWAGCVCVWCGWRAGMCACVCVCGGGDGCGVCCACVWFMHACVRARVGRKRVVRVCVWVVGGVRVCACARALFFMR